MSQGWYGYPPAYYGPGWQQPAAPAAPSWDMVSAAALVTGLVGLGPVPLALGVAGAVRTAGGRRRGRWMAWVGMALGLVACLFWVAVGAFVALLLRPLPADVGAPRVALASQLSVGNCLESLPADGQVWAVHVVPCADAHVAQVIARQDLIDPPAGQTRLDKAAVQWCATQPWPADVPTPASSPGQLVVWAPTPGHTTVTCLATTPDM